MDVSYRKLLSTTNATPLSDLTLHTTCIVYGIVTAFKPPRKTNGTDYMCHVHIADPTYPEGLSINIFHSLENLPEVQYGNVVECAIKVQMYNSKLQGLSLKGPDFCFQIIENGIAAFLREWGSSSTGTMPLPYTRPVLEVGSLKDVDTFCDLYAQVLHINEPDHPGQPLELVVTDYTTNPNIHFPIEMIPYTRLTPDMLLLVTLWDQEPMDPPLQKDTYIHLRNLRIVSRYNKLQVVAHGDKMRTRTSHITIVNDGDQIDRMRDREKKWKALQGDVLNVVGPSQTYTSMLQKKYRRPLFNSWSRLIHILCVSNSWTTFPCMYVNLQCMKVNGLSFRCLLPMGRGLCMFLFMDRGLICWDRRCGWMD
ncbi:uncharacterized protein SPPG_03890 [Spizellomyces punctatus DAOM BR117]|uniref:Telomeric single stranded DNA binding POT1/Cdc13 domain-containing protein n=1 Tax=Spizellomyces punctatus (strain DAOM BR117) TaxID=645134 RepID=A0A0L0HI41_SPIPD|nr:uncharacterized protein SPPG_03890 [Spizellomyces punctatus DAOM BR117]KND00777.1 hypothetical protein SPPG_03890 [Spizellomyces punctatus DAOM BR117]|eukprot:XP_016608816.1 hypothetical protein SPPG_03890 [Spizellomyces punctatus DAOM BR117]